MVPESLEIIIFNKVFFTRMVFIWDIKSVISACYGSKNVKRNVTFANNTPS